VQEGLSNIIRHAGAKHVKLEVTSGGGEYSFTLRDDGRGFDPNSERGDWSHGIMGMQQRVRALGGKFSLDSAPGRGTTLRVTVPATT
jgi:signal transduction histidine kinase